MPESYNSWFGRRCCDERKDAVYIEGNKRALQSYGMSSNHNPALRIAERALHEAVSRARISLDDLEAAQAKLEMARFDFLYARDEMAAVLGMYPDILTEVAPASYGVGGVCTGEIPSNDAEPIEGAGC